jgi:hypothetical protein
MPPIFWVQRQDIGPSPRTNHGVAFDSARQRVVVFGGDPGGPPLADTWTWDGSLWTQVADTGPSPRHGLSLTDFTARQRLVLFGGASGASLLGDTWTFDGTDWIQVADTGPQARSGHAVAFDPIQGFLVLFGGDNGAPLGDTWLWGDQGWTQVQDVGPSPRRGHAMASAPGGVILFGGAGADGSGLDDTWRWDGSNWTEIADTGPEPRVGAAMAGTSSILLFGGVSSVDPALATANRVNYGDTWQFTAEGWAKVQDIGPAPRWGHGAAARSAGGVNRVVVFGGASAFGAAEDAALVPGLRNDTWEVPEPTAPGLPVPQGLQVESVSVEPKTLPSAIPGFTLQVTVTMNAMPPAGTSLNVVIAVEQNGSWEPAPQHGLSIPAVTFNGSETSTSFSLVSDGTFMPPGTYGVAVSIDGSQWAIDVFQAI